MEINISRVDHLEVSVQQQMLSCALQRWGQRYANAEFPSVDHVVQVVLMIDAQVVSYAEIYSCGLSGLGVRGVWTVAAFRRRGCGRLVVEAATEYIAQMKPSFGVLRCSSEMASLYGRCGWVVAEDCCTGSSESEITMYLVSVDKRGLAL